MHTRSSSCRHVVRSEGIDCVLAASTWAAAAATWQERQEEQTTARGRLDQKPMQDFADFWLPLGETVFQDFQSAEKEVGCGRRENGVLGLQNLKFFSRGSAAGAHAPDPPESATLTVTIIPVTPN